jgi:hypothetical protein
MGQTLELERDGLAPRNGPPVDPLLGRTLLHYRVLEVIGQGGMSVVYRGRDEHLARDVAIKVLHPYLREKPECRTRLAREARAVARLEHPNIVKVFDYSGDRPTLDEKPGANNENVVHMPHEGFIVAELVNGPTLKRHAEQCSLWRVPEAGALVVWQLALALQHAHDNGIVHRDLKPENVMVRDDGVLKLMDFGIAQVRDQGGLTITGTLLGSPAHMAPECIDGHAADERSDLFSLGTVLYWLCTGSLPFEALTPHALLKLIVDGKAAPAQQKSPRVSDDLARVIQKSLATKPAERYASAREFAAALEDVVDKAGLHADASAVRALLHEPAARLPELQQTVRTAFLARAQKAVDDGATARALGCLNRVLADDAKDVDARALLDRVDAAADDDVDADDDSAAHNVDADADTAPPTAVVPALVAPRASSTALSRFAVAAAAVGLVVAAVVVARAVDGARGGDVDAVVADEDVNDHVVADGDVDGVSLVKDDGAGAPAAEVNAKKRGRKRNDDAPLVRAMVPVVPPPTTVSVPTAAVQKRKVVFRSSPWADVAIDGVVVAKNVFMHEAELAPGDHTVVFHNPFTKDHEAKFSVAASGPVPEVAARLEPKPANLSVRCNVPDAFVVVDGDSGKTALETLERPLVVSLGRDSKARREVYVYKKGYSAYRKNHTFSAGETTSLDVVLEPDAVDAAPSPTPNKPDSGPPPNN